MTEPPQLAIIASEIPNPELVRTVLVQLLLDLDFMFLLPLSSQQLLLVRIITETGFEQARGGRAHQDARAAGSPA